jgi:hypothetical protein
MNTLMKKNLILIFSLVLLIVPSFAFVQAQTSANSTDSANPNSTGFKIIICNGPKPPGALPSGYVVCDFNGAMLQIQHLIDICMIFGVFAAIILFTYAGYLYITGTEKNITQAKGIFPKIFWGFVIMLMAWFIVYQILSWLTGSSSGFSALLGKP